MLYTINDVFADDKIPKEITNSISHQIDRMDTTIFILAIIIFVFLFGTVVLIMKGYIIIGPSNSDSSTPDTNSQSTPQHNQQHKLSSIENDLRTIHTQLLSVQQQFIDVLKTIADNDEKARTRNEDLIAKLEVIFNEIKKIHAKLENIENTLARVDKKIDEQIYNDGKDVNF